jgi:hypothetical protein
MAAQPFWRFSALSIRRKLIMIIVSICALALLLAAVLDGAVQWRTEREEIMKRLEITAAVIALQSKPALEFIDHKAAQENLLSLSPDPAVRKACLYDEQHALFAIYAAGIKAESGCRNPTAEEQNYHLDSIELYRYIISGGHIVGGIYLQYDLSNTYIRLMQETLIKLGIMLLVIGIVWPVSSYLQRIISKPIVELAAVTRLFSREQRERAFYEP